jgi:hypothetical protein
MVMVAITEMVDHIRKFYSQLPRHEGQLAAREKVRRRLAMKLR